MTQRHRLQEQVRTQKQAHLLTLGECPLYFPLESSLSQTIMSSKPQFLICCHCLHHQTLGSQVGFSLAFLWKLPPQLRPPPCFCESNHNLVSKACCSSYRHLTSLFSPERCLVGSFVLNLLLKLHYH